MYVVRDKLHRLGRHCICTRHRFIKKIINYIVDTALICACKKIL